MTKLPLSLFVLFLAVTATVVEAQTPPVFRITMVSHNEEPTGPGQPDYLNNASVYYPNREAVRLLALTVHSKGAAWNFQSDWNFLKAVARYDTGAVVANTNGKNIVRWLSEDMGVECDPHAHETQYNYADVAYLFTQLGLLPTKNVGGFLYDPPDNGQGWEQHEAGTFGDIYPAYFWKPDNLWGAGTSQHLGNDDKSYGIWKPQDRYNFYVHDPNKNLAYISSACLGSAGLSLTLDRVRTVVGDIQSGALPDTGFYTGTMFISQGQLNLQAILSISNMIDSLALLVTQGKLLWQHLTDMGNAWRSDHQSAAFRLPCGSATGCCEGTTGNVNVLDIVDISDLSILVAYLTMSPTPTLLCPEEANVNATGIIDVSDLSLLIAYLTASPRPSLPECP